MYPRLTIDIHNKFYYVLGKIIVVYADTQYSFLVVMYVNAQG